MPSKSKVAALAQASQQQDEPAPPRPPLLWILLGLLCGAISFALAYKVYAAPAPLGVPLPPLPPPLFETAGVKNADISLVKHKLMEVWLPFLAPQPDGAPPLRYGYESAYGDFKMMFPTGTQSVTYGGDTFVKDGLESQSSLMFDQALRVIKIFLAPRKADQSVERYVGLTLSDLEKQGAKVLPNRDSLKLPAYRFEHYEYEDELEGHPVSHFVYAGPYGKYVLLISFDTTPELHELCRPYAEKIMRSFEPGWKSKKAMLLEDPAYGEYAGSKLPELDL